MRIALAQINTTLGDLDGNRGLIIARLREAEAAGADLVCFPELSLCGYPPEDLLLKRDFLADCSSALRELAREVDDVAVVVGTPQFAEDVFNAAAVLYRGAVVAMYRKRFLPNYGVFDENRYFAPGEEGLVVKISGAWVGITVCEDIWYPGGPLESEVAGGAELVVNISASPYQRGKQETREKLVESRAVDATALVAYVSCVGGQDELVFDGGSMIVHPREGIIARAPRFEECVLVHDVDTSGLLSRRMTEPTHRYVKTGALPVPTRVLELEGQGSPPAGERPPIKRMEAPELRDEEEVLRALLQGLSDYVRKNGFTQVLFGISGGIDSALTAALAAMALGPERVHGVFLPSRFTSPLSREGTLSLVEALGISLETYDIDEILESYLGHAAGSLRGAGEELALENLQARIRGNVLMSISNSRGWLVLATGNKSELSMGYCTLYGDMAGGYAVIKDLLKCEVYRLSRYINEREGREVIPAAILEREPSAELREGQRDTDSLPPYEMLDPILEDYIENGLTVAEMAAKGYDRGLVEEVVRRVDANEYKRRQAPVGIKITPRAFGRDWRLPISIHRPRAGT
ncbi:MAG: NAD+ synthase [Actinomycetota bacterium]|nr:NAD+ synthase [Actinomycetota bacterium]MDD5665679.1 NAD+ synthase [Actinomycetota bacterium]